MPNQSNQNQATTDSQKTPTSSAPPMVPDFMSAQAPAVATTTTTTTTTPLIAQVSDDVPPPVIPPIESAPPPKKKFGGKQIIATILGLLVLAGGIAGGVILTQQNQDIREEAAGCAGLGRDECQDSCSANGFECTWRSATQRCNESGTPCGQGGGGVPHVPGADSAQECNDPDGNGNNSDRIGFWCEGCGGFCLSGSYGGGGCGAAQLQQCNEPIVQGCSADLQMPYTNPDGSTGIYCLNSDLGAAGGFTSYVIYLCSPQKYAQCGNRCDASCYGQILNSIPRNFCGTIQVDETGDDNDHISFRGNDCSTPQPPARTPSPTPRTPTPTPGTAMCVDVKAYTETWTLMAANQLAQLRPGNRVNFCVRGTTTQGTFDRARFTINGVLQSETTAQRPSSTDYCQLYTIPAGTGSFAITAQIHHPTLGWR